MLKSMTGYGRHEEIISGRHITVEIKAVNHKFLEISQRITRGYLFLEDPIKTYLQSRVSRGKIDVYVQIETLESNDAKVLVNHTLVKGYVDAFQEIKETYEITEDISLTLLSKYADILTLNKTPEDEDEVVASVKQIVEKAVDAFVLMRETEGERLKADMLMRAAHIIEIVSEIEKTSPKTVQKYEERLRLKLEEVLQDKQIDEQRILTEAALFADKVAVDEETVRLKSHFKQLENMVESDAPVGRKIDFLVQEMNREANTIASKSMNSEIAYMIVEIKAEIEKIREQVQNIE
ncbi:YicC/YloC family endoribonuclease [Scatolibacter rhodanostii]|uniref:YicC/YloC family endoribonuclease n=1 Tax=Scatolibacter rhodanostii TaxID=2014781 RepID=UPI000C08CFD8|nr:YicC/YloC family endoribonuclease [Scatolibacter rhodanostii]